VALPLGPVGIYASDEWPFSGRGVATMATLFTESHQMFRKTVRDFCERELRPHMDQWEDDELFPRWVFEKAGELGISQCSHVAAELHHVIVVRRLHRPV
jgi:alkylation response protein AidB-like acyl-CoA dehydrogenase